MRMRTSVGLIVIFGVIGVLASVSNEQSSDRSGTQPSAGTPSVPARAGNAPAGRAAKEPRLSQTEKSTAAEKLDYSKPTFTTDYAIVCPQGVLLGAYLDRRAGHGPEEIYSAFTSIWNRSKKVEKLGCEEWRAGIRVFAHPMDPPFQDFVGFSLAQGAMADFFTMEPHLTNTRP